MSQVEHQSRESKGAFGFQIFMDVYPEAQILFVQLSDKVLTRGALQTYRTKQ